MAGLRFRAILRRTLVPVLTIAATVALAGPVHADALDLAIRQLRRTAEPVRGGAHLAMLRSLRQLHDPKLEPFFRQLLSSEDPLVQIHALLGLAELTDPPRFDPWLVERLHSPAARETAVENAVAMDLIDVTCIRDLLSWDDLEDAPRVRLLIELHKHGEPVDPAALAELTRSTNVYSGLAAALLAQLGDAGPLSEFRTRLDALPSKQRNGVLVGLFEEIRRYRLTATYDWISDLLDTPDLHRDAVFEGVFSLLYLDPPRGVSIWNRSLAEDRSLSRRLRFTLMLLALGPDAPIGAYDAVDDPDNMLLTAMCRAGRALATEDADVAEPLIALLDLGHIAATGMAMRRASELPTESATRIYVHLIQRVDGEQRGRDERIELAMVATSQLFRVNPDAIADLLAQATDDSPTQEAILMGLFDTTDPRAGELARSVKRIGAGRADSLAWLLMARFDSTMTEPETRQIGLIASGGGRVSEGLQAQAAWVYIRNTDNIDRALRSIFETPSNGPRPGASRS